MGDCRRITHSRPIRFLSARFVSDRLRDYPMRSWKANPLFYTRQLFQSCAASSQETRSAHMAVSWDTDYGRGLGNNSKGQLCEG